MLHHLVRLSILLTLVTLLACSPPQDKTAVRIALFNIWELSTTKLSDTDSAGCGRNDQLLAAAEIIHRVRPDVLVLNEIDHDIDALAHGADLTLTARRFQERYLDRGANPIHYEHVFAAPCNIGFLTGMDLDNNGLVATPEHAGTRDHGGDCYGYGAYPGQYSMAVLSRYPLVRDSVRTFQKFLWKDLPDNRIPSDWYSENELEIFRLSSKSHWDVPLRLPGGTVHLLLSHPTPPVFDGPEDRNGRRNYDELRMWVHYLKDDEVMVDDAGMRGGLGGDQSFIVAGDLNAASTGDTLADGRRSIDQLLNHPRVRDTGPWLKSDGALMGAAPGPPDHPERRTVGWRGRGMRIDYLLPSRDLEIVDGGVFWPDSTRDPVGAALAHKASDHRMIWLDVRLR